MDKQAAMLTTKLFAMILGVAAYVAFLCTLKPFYMVLFSVLSVAGWYVVYLFILELRRRNAFRDL